jgi:hypothetical protein
MFSYHPSKKILEIVPDKYIEWQPRTDNELIQKYKSVVKVFKDIPVHIILINFEKAIQFSKINFVMAIKFANMFENPPRIEFHKMNEMTATLYIKMYPLLNEDISSQIFCIK